MTTVSDGGRMLAVAGSGPQEESSVGGSSGATVDVRYDYVVKQGNNVARQREWLMRHSRPTVVQTRGLRNDGDCMIMERLQPYTLAEYLSPSFVERLVNALGTVWASPAEVEYDQEAHIDKVSALVFRWTDIAPAMVGIVHSRIDWHALPKCLTHGDPTFENTMRRTEYGPVLIDPVPATPAVPDLRCVDLGKILQSLVGWETIRYAGWRPPSRISLLEDMYDVLHVDENEKLAARYWLMVHLLRTLPYVNDRATQDTVRGLAHDVARGL